MEGSKKVAILHNEVSAESSADELDVLDQVNAVSASLKELGYVPETIPVSLNLQKTSDKLKSINPLFAFNLFESFESTGKFIYFVPALLDHLKIPYTGSGTDEIFITTNKIITKEYLEKAGLPTPKWNSVEKIILSNGNFPFPCIVKPVWEDASVGLDSESVFKDFASLKNHFSQNIENGRELFAEEFIDGREFNISVLASPNGPQVLPQAEIEFIDFPDSKPKIVGYRAKWDENSFECKNTVRVFRKSEEDEELFARLSELSLKCWKLFNLRGYVRVDFRVRKNGQPEILEINANPCISPDSGFVAACKTAGINYTEMIKRIVEDIPGLKSER